MISTLFSARNRVVKSSVKNWTCTFPLLPVVCTYATHKKTPSTKTINTNAVQSAPPPPKITKISGYNLFCQKVITEMQHKPSNFTETLKGLSLQWKQLNETEKRHFMDRASAIKTESLKALKDYEAQYTPLERAKYELDQAQKLFQRLYNRLHKQKNVGKPKGYQLFVMEHAETYKHLPEDSKKGLMKSAADAWKVLPEERKKVKYG
ncbi:hypothetical protein HMI55_006132 [Coelomomyces lativittatus]|nr:hypothetical protein HMI55_006132 [Coelomomyces lativittatus]